MRFPSTPSELAYRTAVKVQGAIDAAKALHGPQWPRVRAEVLRRIEIRAAVTKSTVQATAIDMAKKASGMDALILIAAAMEPPSPLPFGVRREDRS